MHENIISSKLDSGWQFKAIESWESGAQNPSIYTVWDFVLSNRDVSSRGVLMNIVQDST